MAFEVGQRVGEYEILSILGTGGMGRVYRVRNIISDRTEAMKVLLPDLTAEPDLAVRFISEIRTLASFDHPNIAQLHTAFQVDNQLVMMMEFVEGFTLEQRAKQGPMAQDEVIAYVQQVLSALSYAHGRGVVHRDIKPANIMVTSHGVVKLMDFGIAKSKVENDLTRPGTTMGSLYYMSPEQVRGAQVDARSDLYSVGILMYELLAGRRPFDADTVYGILNQQLNVPPQPPIEINPLLPKTLNDLILTALAKDREQRFQSADAFRNALRGVSSQPPQSVDVPQAVPSWAAAAAPGFNNSSSPPIPPLAQRGGQRAVWTTVGALAVLAVLIAAALGLPHFLRTGATAKDNNASSGQLSPGASGTAQQPVASPISQTPSSAPPLPDTKSSGPSQTPVPTVDSMGIEKNPKPGGIQQRRIPYVPPTPEPSSPGGSSENGQPGTQGTKGPSEEEIEPVRDEKTALEARASAVAASVENLRRQQNADGLDLRVDMAGAYARMNSDLRAADSDLNSGNIVAARSHMQKAEREISTLEAFFGAK